MWPGNSPELVKAKMLHNYLDSAVKEKSGNCEIKRIILPI
jgi:hypothetical protein